MGLGIATFVFSHIESIATIGSIVVSFFVLSWRISGKVHLAVKEMQDLQKASALNTASNEEIRKVINNLAKAVTGLRSTLIEREKDIMKLEGTIEATQRTQMELVKSVERASASLTGVWKTLQVLHPDRVPKRASDL